MSSNMDIVDTWHDLLYSNPPSSVLEANNKYLSDDFKSLDEAGNVMMDKKTYTGLNLLLFKAFPDYKAVFSEKREEDDGSVILSFRFEGTHKGDLDLSAMGLGVIPASGKKLVWPESTAKWTVADGKIVRIQSISGGMAEFLEPLGVEIPSQN